MPLNGFFGEIILFLLFAFSLFPKVQLFLCILKPIDNPLGVSPGKGKQGTTRGKDFQKIKRSKDFFFASCGSLFPFTRANAQWVIYGFK